MAILLLALTAALPRDLGRKPSEVCHGHLGRACLPGTADPCTSCATATALQPAANRHPTGNETATNRQRTGNEAATNSVTVRDDGSPSMTMTDNEVSAEEFRMRGGAHHRRASRGPPASGSRGALAGGPRRKRMPFVSE